MGGILLFLSFCIFGAIGLGLCIFAIPMSLKKKKSLGVSLLIIGLTLLAISGSKVYSFLPASKPPPTPYTFNIELNNKRDFSWVPKDGRHDYSSWLKSGFCPISGDITANIFHLEEFVSSETCRNMWVKTNESGLSSIHFDEIGFYDRNDVITRIEQRKVSMDLADGEFSVEMAKLLKRIEEYNSGDQRIRGAMGRWHSMNFTKDGYVYTLRVHRSFTRDEKYALRHVYKPNQSQQGSGGNG